MPSIIRTKTVVFSLMFISLTAPVNANNRANDSMQCNDKSTLISEPYRVNLIRDNFKFLEGPTWSKTTQSFYFSEMDFDGPQDKGPDSTIYQLSLPNKITVMKEHSGSNGLLAHKNELITLNHGTRGLTSINLTTNSEKVITDGYQGKAFNSPNDANIHSLGDIYFTDPDWQLSERKKQIDFTGVFKLSSTGVVSLIDSSLPKPNGIVFSPDEKKLYVGANDNHVYVYPVNDDASLGKRTNFVSIQSPDGMTVDCAGNLYVTSHTQGTLNVYTPKGKLLHKMPVAKQITNVEFGGKDLKTLLITTGNGLYSLETNISGVH